MAPLPIQGRFAACKTNLQRREIKSMASTERQHQVWESAFSDETRQQHLAEDSEAWGAVTGILLTIVSIGACLAVLTVWICS